MTDARAIAAELVGTALLLAIIVGSGLMADRLSADNAGVALLADMVAIGGGLIVLIHMFGPISGAHFNPAVTLMAVARRELPSHTAFAFLAVQFIGGVAGVWLAHAMFDQPIVQVSATARAGLGSGIAEAVATFGLIGTILAVQRHRPDFTPAAVGIYITSACWFTASTSFANPAVTVARALTTSSTGIAPSSVPTFLAGQAVGTLAAVLFFGWLLKPEAKP
ncbi:MIP/aquaporin family protein [Sandarakinorhabdus sp.]|uniref:MIP/aquaporin family protein n=1 Tax=Sandarakinorhabdus sp. TaxID=1916663 RepID=UPI00333FCB0B